MSSVGETVLALPLLAGLAATLLGCAGLVFARSPLAALHCASLVSVAAPVAVGLAAMPAFAGDPGSLLRLGLFVLAAVVGGGASTHALGRALRQRNEVDVGQRPLT